MKYRLVDRRTKEIITTIDLSDDVGISGARTYFMGVKQLYDEKFDELWEVKGTTYKYPAWWVEEKSITDEELKLF
ncbi:hypothetical protein HOE22_07695 [Candidatus Woesearchaeota archaeon]|jgi:hypothetical protein|nr:hypothetical protein [Candidatus Woesearchaeota archaeon]MBT7555456.1 hypothetical protein [Candidatus Woesearchaeota archaeon]|tara:strand:- start:31 stop:255 length:225 start_codon:yes stop_codon:yes gene_type:complete